MAHRTTSSLLSIGLLVLLQACTALEGPQIPDDILAEAMAGETAPAGVPPPMLGEPGQLQVFTTDLSSDGRIMKLRGLVGNPYPDPVDGVRVMFQMFPPDESSDSRQLTQLQKTMDVQISPEGRTALRWDIETMYAAGVGRFLLQAFAIKLGEKQIPPPPGWKAE